MDVDRIRDLIVERVKASARFRENSRRVRLAQEAAPSPEQSDEGTVAERAMRDAFAVLRAMTDPEITKRLPKDARDAPESVNVEDLAGFEPWLANPDLKQYLTECLVPDGYMASGIRVHDLPAIRDSTVEGCSPGGYILSFGYLVIAAGTGGDELCVGTDGRAYWAGHETFADSITFQHPETGALEGWEYTPDNVRRALIPLSESFEAFLISFLTGQLEERLDSLD